MVEIDVRCDGGPREGWTCRVALREGAAEISAHEVRVQPADLARLAPGDPDPATLVERSFAFLLEREPPRSILRSFELLEIARYFPEYESQISGGAPSR